MKESSELSTGALSLELPETPDDKSFILDPDAKPETTNGEGAWTAVEGFISHQSGTDQLGELDRPRTPEEMIDAAESAHEAAELCFRLADVNPAVNLERIARVSHRFDPDAMSSQDKYTLTFLTQFSTNQLLQKDTVDLADPIALAAGHDTLVELQGESADTGPILTAIIDKAEELKVAEDMRGTNDEFAEVITDAVHTYQEADHTEATLLSFIQHKARSLGRGKKPVPAPHEEATPVVPEAHRAYSAVQEHTGRVAMRDVIELTSAAS